VDDLYELGWVDVRVSGPGYVAELLRDADDVDAILWPPPRPVVPGGNRHAHANGKSRPEIFNVPLRGGRAR
jgi:hypothetical protein